MDPLGGSNCGLELEFCVIIAAITFKDLGQIPGFNSLFQPCGHVLVAVICCFFDFQTLLSVQFIFLFSNLDRKCSLLAYSVKDLIFFSFFRQWESWKNNSLRTILSLTFSKYVYFHVRYLYES